MLWSTRSFQGTGLSIRLNSRIDSSATWRPIELSFVVKAVFGDAFINWVATFRSIWTALAQILAASSRLLVSQSRVFW